MLAFASTARAAGYSADIELLRPNFSKAAVPGIDSPFLEDRTRLRAGLYYQYQLDPLVLQEFDQEVGAVVHHRDSFLVGANYDLRRIGFRASLPVIYQWGSEVPELSADGTVYGDLGMGLRLQAFDLGSAALAVRGDMVLPTSTPGSYVGEEGLRATGGLLAAGTLGSFMGLVDASMTSRSRVDTEEDFLLGNELNLHAAVRWSAPLEIVALHGGVLARGGLDSFARGGAENTAEVVGGLQFWPLWPRRGVQIDLGGGRGLTEGYGTTTARVVGGITVVPHWPPKPVVEPPPVEVVEYYPPPEDPPQELSDEPKIVWKEGELARITRDVIVIRDPIQFQFNTAIILPESLPTLDQVADLMASNGKIAHLLIEGHASEEGSYEYNYKLSTSRAESVFERLIEVGVHPDRMSYRGMGETVPRGHGVTEEELAADRRVEFRIVRQLDPLEIEPDYRGDVKMPWSGTPATIRVPPPMIGRDDVLDKPEKEAFDPTLFRYDHDEESRDGAPPSDDGGTSPDEGTAPEEKEP